MNDSRQLTVVPRDRLGLLGERPAPDGLTRRVLARNDSLVVIQGSIPPNRDVPPHGLPAGKSAILAVLHGEVQLGLGVEFDASALKQLNAGDMALFRPDDPRHFARTGGQGADIMVIAFEPGAAMPALAELLQH